ncbi:MAG: hypothetical protein KJP21_05875 [Bacteroidia bacterium]|nr:hypothetical protein [Bacteroidia bacterium]NNJ56775.1 hypothetical protein [Bacteroidia bacterium]
MKKTVFSLLFLSFCILASAQNHKNEIALVIAPLKFQEATSYQTMYRRVLKENLKFRTSLRLYADTDKEIRSDTLSSNQGTVQYDLAFGIQKDLTIGDLDDLKLYVATDAYYNSEFNRKSHETFYGYYWNFGLRPIAGISYEPFHNIRLSLESRANFNVNLQEYSAPGDNADTRFTFKPMDQLAISLGYLF